MTKLDEAIYYADTVFVNAESVEIWDKSILRLMLIDESKMADVIRAARAYADLLKLAPEIGALVEAVKIIEGLTKPLCMCFAGCPDCSVNWDLEAKEFLDKRAETLKAIHDNLKMWGE